MAAIPGARATTMRDADGGMLVGKDRLDLATGALAAAGPLTPFDTIVLP